MQKLDELLELRRKIISTQEKIIELKQQIRSPKAQIITDMPKGSGGQNSIEEYIMRKEVLDNRLMSLTKAINKLWGEMETRFTAMNLTAEEKSLVKYRYYYGVQWNICTAQMKKQYGTQWNENRVYRIRRNIFKKITAAA